MCCSHNGGILTGKFWEAFSIQMIYLFLYALRYVAVVRVDSERQWRQTHGLHQGASHCAGRQRQRARVCGLAVPLGECSGGGGQERAHQPQAAAHRQLPFFLPSMSLCLSACLPCPVITVMGDWPCSFYVCRACLPVRLCVSAFVCACACQHLCLCVCLLVSMCVCLLVSICVCVFVCLSAFVSVCLPTCKHLCLFVYLSMYGRCTCVSSPIQACCLLQVRLLVFLSFGM